MSRTRALITATALAAGLLAPIAATTQAADAAAPRTKPVVRFVSYGDKPVTVPKGRRGVIRFRGHKGDVVSLSGITPSRTHLVRRGHKVAAAWRKSGVFRLPRTATYAFRVGALRYDQRVGLLKARVHRVHVDGKAVRTPKARRGYIDMAVVKLSDGDRVTVDDGRQLNLVYLPNGRYASFWGQHILLQPGQRIRANDDNWPSGRDALAGKTMIRVRSGHRVTVASAVELTVTPDGAPVTIDGARRAAREYVFGFDAAADDLVYLDAVAGAVLTNYTTLLDRWGTPVGGLLSQVDPFSPSFVLPAGGHHEISTVSTELRRAGASVRLRKGIRLPAIAPDGPALDVTFDGSGTRLYSLASGIGRRLESTTTDLDPAEAWMVEIGPRAPWTCGADPYGPLGCADNGYGIVSNLRPDGDISPLNLKAPTVVATPDPGTTGTVHLRLLSTPGG